MNDEDILGHYGRALDEVYRLRRQLAYEASVLEVHLGYATFPKSRRGIAEDQVERMRQAARGEPGVLTGIADGSLRLCMQEAEAAETLTRSAYEATL